MEKINISIVKDRKVYHFEVADYPHHTDDQCKFEVFQEGKLVAGFDPDNQKILHLCKNSGEVPNDILYMIADQIETRHW